MPSLRACIFILVTLSAFSLSQRANALEMSSKRNCAICHVMWLDDFRTDKETLIKWQPGNVLMKDTQGVVSSEEMCYSCHDGYVVDSRYTAWQHNQHKTFIKPPKNFSIPANFPLSNKNEIYCGTCHSAHGGGSNTDASISGGLSFLRTDNINSLMCEKCHTKQAAFKKYNGHPTKAKSDSIPEILFVAGGKRSKTRDLVICQTCHVVHGAKGRKLTVIDNQGSALCTVCHEEQRSLIQTKHDLRISLPDEKNIREQKPSDSGPCGACHLPHNGSGKWMWAKTPIPGERASQQCLACHSKDSELKIKHIGKYSHPINIELSANKSTSSRLPLFLENGSKNPAGKVQCFTCHDPHRWNPDSPLLTGGKEVEGNGSNSFLRISVAPSSQLCTGCHQDKEQLITSDHNLEVTAPEEKNLQENTARDSGPCGACHLPHNASGKRLWAKPLTGGKDLISDLCAGCHNKTGAAKKKLLGNNSHPVDVALLETKMGSIIEKISAELPLYSKNGDTVTDGAIACDTCHEPHRWTPSKSGPLAGYNKQNMEGDGANSFLRKPNFPSAELCEVCHLANGRVDGTKHDLRERDSKGEKMSGQIFEQSGLCNACHLVHNAQNKLKLWASPSGPTLADQSPMDGLCTSCHSEGNIAAKKTPTVAFHPPGKLITNIMRFNKGGTKYTPIFAGDGKEKNVGNLSCPSCHNAHQWGIPVANGATGNRAKDKLTKSSRFLRPMSYNAVCRECHGPEGISRYIYFHNPLRRLQK